MIKLNLISPEQQNYLTKTKRFSDVENILGLMVLTVILIAIILIPFNNSVTILEESVNYDKKSSSANNKLLTNKITTLNDKITVLHLILTENYNWTDLLIKLSKLTPEDVTILEFNGQIKAKQFNLHGFAKTRDSYLKFRSNLEASDNFSDLDFPLSDILKKEEITFEIKGTLK